MTNWKPPLLARCDAPALRVQTPHLLGEPLSPAAALHAALELARRVDRAYAEAPAARQLQVIEPILAGTYVLISERRSSGQWAPIGWLAYALFDADAERRHVNDPLQCLPSTDWCKGDRLWIVHWIAAPGHTHRQLPLLRQLFMNLTARSAGRRAGRVVTWRGRHCSSGEALDFWRKRPLLTPEGARDVGLTHGNRYSMAC